MNSRMSRRTLLLRGLQVPVAGGVLMGLSACGGDQDSGSHTAMVCADPGTMTSAEESVRRTLNYAEISPDSAKTCVDCEFFHAATEAGGCGTCEMFGGKPVNPGGHCDSWSVDA